MSNARLLDDPARGTLLFSLRPANSIRATALHCPSDDSRMGDCRLPAGNHHHSHGDDSLPPGADRRSGGFDALDRRRSSPARRLSTGRERRSAPERRRSSPSQCRFTSTQSRSTSCGRESSPS